MSTTRAPAATKARPTARPIPWLLPVIRAVLPVSISVRLRPGPYCIGSVELDLLAAAEHGHRYLVAGAFLFRERRHQVALRSAVRLAVDLDEDVADLEAGLFRGGVRSRTRRRAWLAGRGSSRRFRLFSGPRPTVPRAACRRSSCGGGPTTTPAKTVVALPPAFRERDRPRHDLSVSLHFGLERCGFAGVIQHPLDVGDRQ